MTFTGTLAWHVEAVSERVMSLVSGSMARYMNCTSVHLPQNSQNPWPPANSQPFLCFLSSHLFSKKKKNSALEESNDVIFILLCCPFDTNLQCFWSKTEMCESLCTVVSSLIRFCTEPHRADHCRHTHTHTITAQNLPSFG